MNYGLWLSASGMQTNTWRQDVFANNLANASTVGFKRDLAELRQRDPESVESPARADASHWLLDKLGGGVLAAPMRTSFEVGPIEHTGLPSDVALDQRDTFLVVRTGAGPDGLRLTRDGRLMRSAAGDLVTAAGHPVLNADDQPIRLNNAGPFLIQSDGVVVQDGAPVGQMQITGVTDMNRLIKQGANLFKFENGTDLRQPVANATVRPEHIEASSVDPIKALMQLVEATKAISSNGNMIRYHDQLMDRAVNVLGRVA